MIIPSKTYDVLKFIAQIILPGIGTLWFTLATIWTLPYANQILGSIMAIDLFLGGALGLSSANYNKTQNGS